MRMVSIASGSSGNCIYVGSEATHLLVDVGISGKKAEAGLNSLGLTGRDLDGILVTHEHMDHVAGRNVKPIGQLGQRKLLGKAQVHTLQNLGCKRECGIRRTQLEAMRHRRHLHQQRLQKRCPGGSRGLFRVEQQQKHPCRCSL